jgi:uncharacterized protein YeaO (DUF488 family)
VTQSTGTLDIRLKRAYDPPSVDDGERVLVDRLWPRGIAKDDDRIDEWCRDAAPSTELRRWYQHEPARAAAFAERYRTELGTPGAEPALHRLHELMQAGTVTLVTATKQLELSHVPVLAAYLR